MPYRMNIYREKDGKFSENKDCKHQLHIDQAEKAIITFEMDFLICRLFISFTDSIFGDAAKGIRQSIRNREELPDDVTKKLDLIFEDILAFVEFYQNRITTQGDPAIERMMVHGRFTTAYLLDINWKKADAHKHPRSNKKMNTAMFRHDLKDDLREISHIDYNRIDLKKMISKKEVDYNEISDVIQKTQNENVKAYYDRIMSSLENRDVFYVRLPKDKTESKIWHDVLKDKIKANEKHEYAQLFDLIDALKENSHDFINQYQGLDFKDMRNCTIRMVAPALGQVSKRDEDLESSLHTPFDVVSRYPRELVEDNIIFTRMLDCIFGNSTGERNRIELSISLNGLIRLLDPRLFGWKYDIPPVIFCMDSKEPYDHFMDGFSKITQDGIIIMDSVRIAQSQWTFGKRMKPGNRVPGGLCKFQKPVYVEPSKMRSHMMNVREPSIIVTTDSRLDDMLSLLGSFTRVADKNKVNSVVALSVVDHMVFPGSLLPYTTVMISKPDSLFDILTLHNVELMDFALMGYTNAMAKEIGVNPEDLDTIEATDFRTAFFKAFGIYSKQARADIEKMESYFR